MEMPLGRDFGAHLDTQVVGFNPELSILVSFLTILVVLA